MRGSTSSRRCRSSKHPPNWQRSSAAVQALNGLGAEGWEAVGMTVLADDSVAVLFKRPASGEHGTFDVPVGRAVCR